MARLRPHPGYLGAQDNYYFGTIKSIGRMYPQTFIDTYTKVAFAKLYDRKNALVAADMLNDRVVPFFEKQEVPLLRILIDRGTEYCGQREHHDISCTWRWRTLITAELVPSLRRPTLTLHTAPVRSQNSVSSRNEQLPSRLKDTLRHVTPAI